MTKRSIFDVDRRIAGARTMLDRATRRLVDIDADVTRQLLAASGALRGQTASRWADASSRLDGLWRDQLALDQLLERVAHVRQQRLWWSQAALAELDDLLEGAHVLIAQSDPGPLTLTGNSARVRRTTIEAVLEQMSRDYDIVAALVCQVAEVWAEPTQRLDALAHQVREVADSTTWFGAQGPPELATLAPALAAALDQAHHDPLELDLSEVEVLEERVARLVVLVSHLARGRHERDADLIAISESVQRGMHDLAQGKSALADSSARVVMPTSASEVADELGLALGQLGRECTAFLASDAPVDCVTLRGRVDELRARLAAVLALGPERVGERDELRGVLEAYRAKVRHLGLAEDAELDLHYEQAQAELSLAPCDVERAARLVEQYRRTVTTRTGGVQ